MYTNSKILAYILILRMSFLQSVIYHLAQTRGTGRNEYIVLGYSWRAPTLAPPVPPNVKHETAPWEEVSERAASCITSPTSSQ